MATTLQFAARLNIQADGATKVQSQIDGLEKELVEAMTSGDKTTQQWLKSMINVAKVTKEVVASIEKLGNANIGFDPSFIASFQSGIQKAVEQGVINGMAAGKQKVQTASVSGQTATQSVSLPVPDIAANQSLTASITRLDASIVNFANALNRQNSLAGGNVRSNISQATGRPQFDIFQEVSEVALREQGKELRGVAADVIRFLGEGERVLQQKRQDVKSIVQNLSSKLDFQALAQDTSLEGVDLGDTLGSSQADIISDEIFSSINQKFSVQLLSDTESLFKVFHNAFLKLQSQGFKGSSLLIDEQGKWLTETEAGQRLMARMASRFAQNMLGQNMSMENLKATSFIKSPAQGSFNIQDDFINQLEGQGTDEIKQTLDLVMQLFKNYEEIEATKKSIADLERQTKDNSTGALQNLERMLALNRDQFALAKQNNTVSSRYTNILQQNNALLAQAPKAVSYAILEGDLSQLIALQREYSHQVQRATNLNKDLEVQANRQRNLAAAYAKDAARDMATTIENYGKLSIAISGVTAKLIAQDAASRASGGSPQFANATNNVMGAAQGLQNLLGGDTSSLIESMLGGDFQPQMAAKLIEVLKTGIQAAATNPEVGQAMAPLMQQLAEGMTQFAAGASTLDSVSDDEAKQLNETAIALKHMADRAAEAASNQYKFSEAAKQSVKQQVLLEQQTTAVAKILQTLRSETRISEEGLRIVEKQLRRLNAIDFKFNAMLVAKDDIDGLTKTQAIIERIRSIGGIFDQNAIDEVKSHTKGLKELRDQLISAKYDIEAARQSQIGRINDEASRARQGAADSEFSGIAPENLEVEVKNRLDAVNRRFDEMAAKINSDLQIAEKSIIDFGNSTQSIVRQGERLGSAFKSIDDISFKIQNLQVQSALLNRTKIADSIDLTIIAGQYKQLSQDIDTVSRKNRELRAQMLQTQAELLNAKNNMISLGSGATGEDLARLAAIEDRYDEINRQLLESEKIERDLVNVKNSRISQETILANKRIENARQMASAVRDFDVADSNTIATQLKKDLKSLNVDVLARASNEFKSLRSNISSALQQAQKALAAFQAQEKRSPLSADDQASSSMLKGRIKELEELQDRTAKMEVSAKSADSRLKEQVITFQEYGQNLRQMIRGQVDFAIGTGVITAGFAGLATAFREVLNESRAVSRAITVLQSNLLTTAQITEFTYEKTRKLAVQYGMTVGAVADIAKELGSAGFKLEEVSRGWEATLRAINATNADATTVTRAVSGIYAVYRDQLKAAGQEAQAFGIITNTLTSIFQNHQAEMDEIVQGYKFVVGTGKVAGFSFQQMGAYLAVLNDNMIKSGMAGRSLQVVFAQMASKTTEISQAFGIDLDPSKTVAEQFNAVLEQMHAKIGDAEVSAGQLNEIFKIFDKQGARAFATLVQQYPSVRKALNELEFGAEGVTAKMNDIINNSLDRKFYQMKQAALDFAREGFDAIKPVLIDILVMLKAFFRMINDLNKMSNGLASTSLAFIGLSFAIFKTTYAMIALSASMGGSFFASAVNGVSSLVKGFAALTNTIWGAGAAMINFARAQKAAQSVSGAGRLSSLADSAVGGLKMGMSGIGAALMPALVVLGKAALIIAAILAALYLVEKVVEKISGGFSIQSAVIDKMKTAWDATGGSIYEAYTRVDRLTESLDKSRAELARLRKEAADFKSIMELAPPLIEKIQKSQIGADVGAEQIQTMIRDAGGDVSARFSDVLAMSAERFGSRLRDDLIWAAEFEARMEADSHAFKMSNIEKQKKEREKELADLVNLTNTKIGAGIGGDKNSSTQRLALRFATQDSRIVGKDGRLKSIKDIEKAYNDASHASRNYSDAILKSLSPSARKEAMAEIGRTKALEDSLEALRQLKKEADKTGTSVENLLIQNGSEFKQTLMQITGLMNGMGMTVEQVSKSSGMKTLAETIFPEDPARQEAFIKSMLGQIQTVIKRNVHLLNPDTTANLSSMKQPVESMINDFNFQGSPDTTKQMYDLVFEANVTLEANKNNLIDSINALRDTDLANALDQVNSNPVMTEITVEAATVAGQNISAGVMDTYFNTSSTDTQIKDMERYFETVKKGSSEIGPALKEAARIRKELMKGDLLTEEQKKKLESEAREIANLIARAALDPQGFDALVKNAGDDAKKAFEKVKGRIFEGLGKDVVSINATSFMASAKASGRGTDGAAEKLAQSQEEARLGQMLVELEKLKDGYLKGNASRIAETNSLLRKQYDLNSIISKRTLTITSSAMKLRDMMKNVNFETKNLVGLKEQILKIDSKTTEAQLVAIQTSLKQELARFSSISDNQLRDMKDDEKVAGTEVSAGQLKVQRQMQEEINSMLKEKQQLDAQAIGKAREIAYQKESERNAYNEKLKLFTKELLFYSDFSAAQSRLNDIQFARTDGLIREMQINRELVANSKFRINNAKDLSKYLDMEYEAAQKLISSAKNEKQERAAINQVMGKMHKNTGSMLKLMSEASNEAKNLRTYLQKFADEGTTAIETIGAAQTLLFGDDNAAAKAIQSMFSIYSKLPALDLNTTQIDEVKQNYKILSSMAQTDTQQAAIRAEYEDNMIFLLNKRVKLIKDITSANKELTKQIKEQLVEDRRPELYKEIVESLKRMQEPLKAEGEKQIEDMYSRNALETTKALVAVTGDDLYWAIDNNKEAIKQFFLAVENGKANFDNLSSSITRTLQPQLIAYREMLDYEDQLMKAQLERAKKAGGVLSKSIVEGDFSRANSQFSTMQSSVIDAVKMSGNERELQAVSKKLIEINNVMLDTEKYQSDMLLKQLELNTEYLASIEGLMKQEATNILNEMSGIVGDFSSLKAIEDALEGGLEVRRSDIELLRLERLKVNNERLQDLSDVLDKFGRNLNIPNTLDPTAGVKAGIKAASVAENALMSITALKQRQEMSAIASQASEAAKKSNKIDDKKAEIDAQKMMREAQSKRLESLSEELFKLADVSIKTRFRVENLTSSLEAHRRKTNALEEVEQKYGGQILDLLAANNLLWKVLKDLPELISTSAGALFSMFSGLGNLDYAIQNAEALVNYQKQLVQVTDNYNSSVTDTTTALRRNETEFYDYINAIQDAERQRAKELLEAQKTYRESLKKTSEVMKEQFLTPGANAIGSGLGKATGFLGDKSQELFGTSLKKLVFDVSAGPDATKQGSNFLNNIAKSAAGLLAGVGGTIASTAISGFASVAGQVFDAVMSGNADKLLEFVKRLAVEIPTAVKQIASDFVEFFPEIIDTLVSDVLPTLVDTLVTELPQILSTVLMTFADALPKFVRTITSGLGKIFIPLADALLEGVLALVPALIEAMPDVLNMIPELITKAMFVIIKSLPQILMTVLFAGISMMFMPVDMLLGAINGTLGKLLGFKIPSLTKGIMNAGSKVISAMPKFHSGGVVGGTGEQPAILLGGEGVLNKRAMAMLGKQNLDLLNKGYQPQMRDWSISKGMQRSFDRPASNTTNMGGLNVTINGVKDAEVVPELIAEMVERRLVKKQQNRETKLR